MSEMDKKISDACELVWDAMRPMGGAFWYELSERERALSVEGYKAGFLAAEQREREACAQVALASPPSEGVKVTDEMVDRFGSKLWGAQWQRGGFEKYRAALQDFLSALEPTP